MGEEKNTQKKMIKEKIENGVIVICDTNVYLNVYRYSPEFTEFAFQCLKCIKDSIAIPATVYMEYRKHYKSEFYAMKTKVKNASNNINSQVASARKKIENTCNLLKSRQYPDIDALSNILKAVFDDAEKKIDDFFDDRNVLEQVANNWGDDDYIFNLVEDIQASRGMDPFTQEQLYKICDEGEDRYKKQVPPGYKDQKNKDGIRKYSDLIIWKEVMNYSKENQLDIIFVTDDVKADWWEKEGVFHPALIQEFMSETGKNIDAYTSTEFYAALSESYSIEKTDAIELALRMTDKEYIERVEDDVFDTILDEIETEGESLIGQYGSHIGTEGLHELEVIDHSFVEAIRIDRQGDIIVYQFKYWIDAEGTSFDYWGRDDDTKEVILSPGAYHRFQGQIVVTVTREVETYIDYEDDSEFDSAIIEAGDLEEVEFKPYFDEPEELPDVYTACPSCGKGINIENDGGNGFCVNCASDY